MCNNFLILKIKNGWKSDHLGLISSMELMQKRCAMSNISQQSVGCDMSCDIYIYARGNHIVLFNFKIRRTLVDIFNLI